MVSRGIDTSDIVKGIHLALSDRILKMLSTLKVNSPVLLTVGMAKDKGLLTTLEETVKSKNLLYEIKSSTDTMFAGSSGGSILGGFRYERLEEVA